MNAARHAAELLLLHSGNFFYFVVSFAVVVTDGPGDLAAAVVCVALGETRRPAAEGPHNSVREREREREREHLITGGRVADGWHRNASCRVVSRSVQCRNKLSDDKATNKQGAPEWRRLLHCSTLYFLRRILKGIDR